MKKTLAFITAITIALFCNIKGEWHPSLNETVTLGGPRAGIALCAILCAILIYFTFLAIQDFLIAKRYLLSRVRTRFDILPILILIPLGIQYSAHGSTWSFKWGDSEWGSLYFISILVVIFAYQIYRVVKAATEAAKNKS